MRRLGLDTQSLFGMPALDHARLAGSLGCGHVSLSLTPLPWKLAKFPDWSLRSDGAMRRDLAQALADCDIVIAQGEGFSVRPGKEVDDLQGDLDIFANLGARSVGGVCMERDMARAYDQLDRLADLAGQRGMRLCLEFAPPHGIPNFAKALEAVSILGRTNIGLTIDAMHFFRSGSDITALATCDPQHIAYAQICDVPASQTNEDYFDEACFERLMPGEGNLPLAAFLAALPNETAIGVEIPMRSRAIDTETISSLMKIAVAATSNLLNSAQG